MNPFSKLIALCFLLLTCANAMSQERLPVLFKSGAYYSEPAKNEIQQGVLYSSDELVEGSFFRLIQFNSIPTNDVKRQLESQGITLLNYIPRNAFFARISTSATYSNLSQFEVNSIEKIDAKFKLTKSLLKEEYPHWTLYGTSEIELNGSFFEGISQSHIESSLTKLSAEVLHINSANTVTLRIALDKLNDLYALSVFYYFEPISPPEEPENLVGRTDHRSNTIATEYDGGLKFDGTGVTVMMQDDGYIGDHIDYQGRVDQSNCSPCSTADGNNHGDHVAGTIMGAGNIDPKARGMAFGANLLVYNSNNDNYDLVPALYASNELVITSKSYSAGCNGGYDSRARQLDQQIRLMPSLMHVFSAGNSGASDCGYGAGTGWGNITGGHKSGKNVIAVGNLTSVDGLSSSSSRGPATDGRIKPDICGVGTSVYSTISDYLYDTKTGTSMSCPGVAGSVAQLYHAYKDLNGGMNPNSALIKAAILNTAKDLGNPGPDFKHGWGRINVGRAHALISQNNYIFDSIEQAENNVHTITVPAGITQLKLMLYWADFEGVEGASIALVNDLNLELIDPGLVSYNPWVLNPAPNGTTLDEDAVQGVDNLNNMEQVTIDNPLPGMYTINVDGFAIPEGPQEYFIVYEFVEDKITLTYPLGGEGFSPGTGEIIRWDASESVTDFELEYTVDNGAVWNSIAAVNADARHFSWVVPAELSGLARVRVLRGAQISQSEDVFSIIPTPENLDVAWACPDSMNLVWDSVPGATGYEVSMLGAQYMDSIGTSLTNNLTIAALSTDENWFSVRSLGPDNARSERAIALRKVPGQFGCTWSSPIADLSIVCDSVATTACVQVMNESVNVDGSSTYQWYFPGGTPATSTDENPTVCYTSSGLQDAALVVTNSAGSDSSYFFNYVFIQGAMEIPYHEGFENLSNFIGLESWSVNNPDGNSAFQITSSTALSGVKSARLYNHNQDEGSVDELISGPINLSVLDPITDIMTLSFRYAYRKIDGVSDDWLRIYVRNGCDDDWAIRKTLHGVQLSTLENNSPWTPSSPDDWTTVHMTNITSNYFTGDFRFKFNFENGGGNNFYLDDINIYSGAPSDDIVVGIEENNLMNAFELFPNPADDELNVRFALTSDEVVNITIVNILGKTAQYQLIKGVSGANLVILDTDKLAPGVYFISLEANGVRTTEQFVVR